MTTPIEALRELIACKDLKDRLDGVVGSDRGSLAYLQHWDEYDSRKPIAWANARAAITAHDALPVAEPDAIAFAVSVFDDVLSDIADWEDKTLSEACIEAKRRLCAAPAAQPDTKLCKRLIDEVVRRNGGSTPNWLIDMAPNTGDLNVQYR